MYRQQAGLCTIKKEDQIFFIDYILIPALVQVLPSHSLANFGISYQADQYRRRNYKGRLIDIGSYLPARYLEALVNAMRGITKIRQRSDPKYNCQYHKFNSFFFISKTHGIKEEFTGYPLEDIFSTNLDDFNWECIKQDKNVIIDIGFEFTPTDNDINYIGIWKKNPSFSDFRAHKDLLTIFWNSRGLSNKNIRLDPFSNFKSLGGFRYQASAQSRPIINGILQMQVYQKIKVPFYNHDIQSDRTGKDFNPDWMWKSKSTKSYSNHMVRKIYLVYIIFINIILIFLDIYRTLYKNVVKLNGKVMVYG